MKDYFSDLSISRSTAEKPMVNPSSQGSSPSNSPAVIPATPETAIAMGVIDITKESIRCFTDYMKCREHEKTERKRIAAALRAVQYQIDAQKEVYLKKLEGDARERKDLYEKANEALQVALEKNDKEMLQITYNFILNVYNGGLNSSVPVLSNSTIDCL